MLHYPGNVRRVLARPVYAIDAVVICRRVADLKRNRPLRQSPNLLPCSARNRSGIESPLGRLDLSCAAIADQKIEEPREKPMDFTRLRSRAYVFARCHGAGIWLNRPAKIQQKVTSEPGDNIFGPQSSWESISNRGLRCPPLNFGLLLGLHSRIPANEGLPELVIEHLGPHLEQSARVGICLLWAACFMCAAALQDRRNTARPVSRQTPGSLEKLH